LQSSLVIMNLRCTFHVQSTTPTQEPRAKMPSMIDVEVDYVDEPMPRGRSHETWTRARGWGSED